MSFLRLRSVGPSRLALGIRRESTAAFVPALPKGVDAGYDAALAFLDEHNAAQRARLEKLKAAGGETSAKRIAKLEVDAYINDPAVRRTFAQTGGKGHMQMPVMRYLARRAFEKDGEKDLVLQRVHQLGVVPDLVPDISLRAALRLGVEAGSVQPARDFAQPPSVSLQLFDHPTAGEGDAPSALFTLLAIDPDTPDNANQAFSQRVLYAKQDIPASILTGEENLFSAGGKEVLAYEPPTPAQGSGTHRIVFVAVQQRASGAGGITRDAFDLRAWLAENQLSAADVVAMNMYRTAWTPEDAEFIDSAYLQYRGTEAPVYGKPPKEMRYGYPLSAKAQRAHAVRQLAWDNVLAQLEQMEDGAVPAKEAETAA